MLEGRRPLKVFRTDDPGAPNSTNSWLQIQLLNAASGTVYAGTSQVQRNILGESILGLPARPSPDGEAPGTPNRAPRPDRPPGGRVSDIHIDVTDGIATVTIDRPPVNALDSHAFRDLAAAFAGFRDRTDVRVAILTSSGGRAFCAGVDLNDSARRHAGGAAATDANVAAVLDPGRMVRDCFWAVYDCAVPVIAAVNGAAIGAGLALVACCDILLCSDDARFALTEVDAGVLGGGRHLQRLVGSQFARRMMFTVRLRGRRRVLPPGRRRGRGAAATSWPGRPGRWPGRWRRRAASCCAWPRSR